MRNSWSWQPAPSNFYIELWISLRAENKQPNQTNCLKSKRILVIFVCQRHFGAWKTRKFATKSINHYYNITILLYLKIVQHLAWCTIFKYSKIMWNIARGTTDPEIDSVTWTKLGNNMMLLALVSNFATRFCHWHWLQIWPPDGTTWISYKFGHQVVISVIYTITPPI